MFKLIATIYKKRKGFPGKAVPYSDKVDINSNETFLSPLKSNPNDKPSPFNAIKATFRSPDEPINPPFLGNNGQLMGPNIYTSNRHFEMGNIIGVGGMADVFELKETELVIKFGKKLRSEAATMSQLSNSKYITQNLGTGREIPSKLNIYGEMEVMRDIPEDFIRDYIVMEKGICSGSLFTKIPATILKRDDIDELVKHTFYSNLILTMARAIRDVHDQGFAHNDLKDTNFIVFNGEPKLKLADFGTTGVKEIRPKVSTFSMIPPEEVFPGFVEDSESPRTFQHRDMFHLGLILAKSLLNGRHIYEVFPKVELNGSLISPFDMVGVRDTFNRCRENPSHMKQFLHSVYTGTQRREDGSPTNSYNEGLSQFGSYMSDTYPYLDSIKPLLLRLLSLDYKERPTALEVCESLTNIDDVLPLFKKISSHKVKSQLDVIHKEWDDLAKKEQVDSLTKLEEAQRFKARQELLQAEQLVNCRVVEPPPQVHQASASDTIDTEIYESEKETASHSAGHDGDLNSTSENNNYEDQPEKKRCIRDVVQNDGTLRVIEKAPQTEPQKSLFSMVMNGSKL